MKKKKSIYPQEMRAYRLFNACLPYYWTPADELPAGIRFRLAMNGYGSAVMACNDIVNRRLCSPKLAREAQRALTHMQTWKGVEPQ